MTTNPSKTRTVLYALALAAIGSAGAYGLTATAADLSPRTEPARAGISFQALEVAPTPPVERRGITFNFLD